MREAHSIFFLRFRPGQAGKALLPDGTRESFRNQESEQSSATIVPQLSVVADMTRRSGCRERTLSMPPQHPDVGTRQTRPCVHGTAMSHDRMWMIAHTCQQPQMQEYGHKRLETSGKYCTMRLLVWLERPPPVTRGHVKAPCVPPPSRAPTSGTPGRSGPQSGRDTLQSPEMQKRPDLFGHGSLALQTGAVQRRRKCSSAPFP